MSTLSLEEAKDWLRDRVDDGARCPCCQQFAKVYRRKINSGMARALIQCYLIGRGQYVHATELGSHETAQLQWWGLLEEQPAKRPDGGRTGWWRITPLGEDWMRGKARVPKYVAIYDGKLMAPPHGDWWGIREAVGTKFDLDDLMAGL